MMRSCCLLAGLGVAGCHPAPGTIAPATDRALAERFAATVDSLRVAARIPGLAVAVLRDTTVILAAGQGFANVAARIPVTPNTPFNIASVAKPIGAVVALRLAERGLLDLDRSMRSYQGFVEFCDEALGAGGIFFGDYACRDPGLSLRQVLGMTANGPPGTRFLYNPPSYSWASRPMAEVGGASFSELTATLVFQPAGMTRSARKHRRLPLVAELAADLALPYRVDSSGGWVEAPPPPPQGDGAAGGVISTALDLARFDQALTRGILLTEKSRAEMWTPRRSPSGETLPYGLGWFIKPIDGEPVVWHTGLWEGAYSALYLKLPTRRLTLILLANSDGLQWPTGLDQAVAERSPFVRAFLAAFPP